MIEVLLFLLICLAFAMAANIIIGDIY